MSQNPFGGGNAHSLYVPMSEDEQEVMQRLRDSKDYTVLVHGWGHFDAPPMTIGDARVSFLLDMTFSAPLIAMPVRFFDMELQTRGETLFRQHMALQAGNPVMIGSGTQLVFAWDIMIHHLDPELVKRFKPGALGLTSRRLDRDTKEPTLRGNMQTTPAQDKLLQLMHQGEARVRADDQQILTQAAKDEGVQVKKTAKGLIVPEVK